VKLSDLLITAAIGFGAYWAYEQGWFAGFFPASTAATPAPTQSTTAAPSSTVNPGTIMTSPTPVGGSPLLYLRRIAATPPPGQYGYGSPVENPQNKPPLSLSGHHIPRSAIARYA